MATLRPSLFSRWVTQPTELLLRATRASPSQSQKLALSVSRTNTRSFNSLATRFTTRTRPTPRPRTIHRSARRSNSSNAQSSQTPKESNSLSQRLRTLSREYGWAALGVYLGLSALDFPFCFVAVRLLGVERIGHWEHVVVSSVKDALKSVWPASESDPGADRGESDGEGDGAVVGAEGEEGKGMEEASMFLPLSHAHIFFLLVYMDSMVFLWARANIHSFYLLGIWTQLALAYAVHKSLIFIRVPLTAAVTPKIVKVLRRWGWDIGKRKPKST